MNPTSTHAAYNRIGTMGSSPDCGVTSTNWQLITQKSYEPFVGSKLNEFVTISAAMQADFDFQVVLNYSLPVLPANRAEVTMHGEDHGTQPGVQYSTIALKTIGDRYVLPVGPDLWAV